MLTMTVPSGPKILEKNLNYWQATELVNVQEGPRSKLFEKRVVRIQGTLTDAAIVMGATPTRDAYYEDREGNRVSAAFYWTQEPGAGNPPHSWVTVGGGGYTLFAKSINTTSEGVRPVIEFDDPEELMKIFINRNVTNCEYGCKKGYVYAPVNVVSEAEQERLIEHLNNSELTPVDENLAFPLEFYHSSYHFFKPDPDKKPRYYIDGKKLYVLMQNQMTRLYKLQ